MNTNEQINLIVKAVTSVKGIVFNEERTNNYHRNNETDDIRYLIFTEENRPTRTIPVSIEFAQLFDLTRRLHKRVYVKKGKKIMRIKFKNLLKIHKEI